MLHLWGRGAVAVVDGAAGTWECIADSTMLSACFGGLAMGWSWALFLCHDVLTLKMSRAMEELGWLARMAGAVDAPSRISRLVPACAPYVDTANIIALGRGPGTQLHRAVIKQLDEAGLVRHDEHGAEAVFEILGLALHGPKRMLTHTRRRAWRMFCALDDLVHRSGVHGDVAQRSVTSINAR